MLRNTNPKRKRRSMTSDQARRVRANGFQAEEEFASLISGRTRTSAKKKDVIDQQNGVHSVKSGKKKWQIFLYTKQRFQQEIDFQGCELFIELIDSFPNSRENYVANKDKYKNILKGRMVQLKDYLSRSNNKLIFFKKAFLNNGEVDYFTIKEGDVFHVFDGQEVIETIDNSTVLVNSKAKRRGEIDDQKVVFKLANSGVTIGEIEMRNDSPVHYRQVKFWMYKEKTLNLLKSKIRSERQKYHRVIAHGRAISKFRIL